jgi:hypothetical protein
MKKLLLSIFAAAILVLTGCDPPQYSWRWEMKNNTSQTISVKFIPRRHNDSASYGLYVSPTVAPGGVVVLDVFSTKMKKGKSVGFADYFRQSANSYGNDVYWQILSEDGTVLKTWNYSDINSPDQRFFNESSWDYKQGPGTDSFVVASHYWLFEISEEDINTQP